MRATIVLAGLLALAPRAGAVCLGDFNGDGMVAINEIVTSVVNALNGCQNSGPTPTPTPPSGMACPIDFSNDNTAASDPVCFYIGPWNQTCGADDLGAYWVSDTTNEVVVIEFLGFSPSLFFGAATTSATSADLIGWFQQPDASDLTPVTGSIFLNDGGRSLLIEPCMAPFRIEMCDFVAYQGALTEVSEPTPASARALRRPAAAALQRLRGALTARHDKADLRRQ